MLTKVIIVDVTDKEDKKELKYEQLPQYLPQKGDFIGIQILSIENSILYEVINVTHSTNLYGWCMITIFVVKQV